MAAGTSAEVGKRRVNHKDADRWRDLPPALWDIMNVPADSCVRLVGLTFFDDEKHKKLDYLPPYPCCSTCDPDFQLSTACHETLNKTAERNSSKRHWYALKIRQWRDEKAETIFSGSYLRFFSSLIMPDEVLESLATWAEHIRDEPTMRHWVGDAWTDIRLYWPEILEILERGQAMMLDKGEMFDVWQEHQDIKRKRISAPVDNPAKDEFEERRTEWMIKCGYASNTNIKKRKATKGKAVQMNSGKSQQQSQSRNEGPTTNDSILSPVPACSSIRSPNRVEKLTRKPRSPRQALREISPNVSQVLSSTRSRENRRLPSRYT